MSFDTLTVPVQPDLTSQGSQEPRVLRADFGDGYSQRAQDGLNNIKDTPTFQWFNLAPSDADALRSFFQSHGGWKPFNYTVPEDSTPTLFITSGAWTTTYLDGGYQSVKCKFEKVYDLP